MASLDDILTTLQGGVKAMNANTLALNRAQPTQDSGQLSADALVQTGFVRVTGISVVVAGAVGGLYDAATIVNATAGQQIYVVPAAVGFTAVNMVFNDGLVYKPGAGQKTVIFFTRV